MSISLAKGQAISLAKDGQGSSKYEARLSWDMSLMGDTDLDVMCLLCGDTRKVILPQKDSFIFYGNLKSKDGSVVHSGDERTGAREGWDEVITIDFKKLSNGATIVPVFVNIHDMTNSTNFGMARNVVVEIFDVENQKAVAQYRPEMDAMTSISTTLIVGEFIKNGTNFMFKALNEGTNKGLVEVLKYHGVEAHY